MKKLLRKLGNLRLPSFFKKGFWRFYGFAIGKGVKIHPTVVLSCKNAKIGDFVEIGRNVRILGPKSFEVGEFSTISFDCVFIGNKNIIIGKNCFLGINSLLDASGDLSIGNNVAIAGSGIQIWTHSTWLEEIQNYSIKNTTAPVSIENDCYIGTGSIILPGVKIGKESIIAAGSVVTKNIPQRILVGGVPAKKIKKIKTEIINFERKKEIISDFLKKENFFDFSFYPKKRGKVVFTNGFDYKYPKKSVFDLKTKTCVIKNKEGVKVRKLLNYYIARFNG